MKDNIIKAVALKYRHREDNAPQIAAKGMGVVAEKILEIAKEYDIPMKEDPQLVEILSTLELYEEIPAELYRAVAEILVFVYKMTREA